MQPLWRPCGLRLCPWCALGRMRISTLAVLLAAVLAAGDCFVFAGCTTDTECESVEVGN